MVQCPVALAYYLAISITYFRAWVIYQALQSSYIPIPIQIPNANLRPRRSTADYTQNYEE